MRNDFSKKGRNGEIVEKILKNIAKFKAKYISKVDPLDLDEVQRRLSMFTQPFVTDCVDRVSQTLQYLKIDVSAALLASKTLKVMELRSIILPEIGASKCVLVRERITQIISNTIFQILVDRLKSIKNRINKVNDEARESRNEVTSEEENKSNRKRSETEYKKKGTVSVHENEKTIIGESSYGEFIGELAAIDPRNLHKFVSLISNFKMNHSLISINR